MVSYSSLYCGTERMNNTQLSQTILSFLSSCTGTSGKQNELKRGKPRKKNGEGYTLSGMEQAVLKQKSVQLFEGCNLRSMASAAALYHAAAAMAPGSGTEASISGDTYDDRPACILS